MANESEESGPAGLETSATAATAQSEEDSVKEKNKKLEEGGEKMPPNEATADVPTAENATSAASEAAAAAVDVKTPLAEDDPPQVKFTSNEAKLEMGDEGNTKSDPYPAMTKSELMTYANDPFWVRLRWSLFIGFWLIWLLMLVASVAIIIVAPKCPAPAEKEWWQKKPVYEVYVKSFKDSNDDGQGDLKGIESKVDYLESLSIGAVWLSPIYPSPQKDNGYDVSDYINIDPTYGTLDDFKDLLAALHERGIKVIMDFIPNHSSDQHEWFKKSVKKEEPYTDFYVWREGTPGRPPTNWRSVFGGSAWQWNDERKAYYLHNFYKEQPDLNVRNPLVVEKLEEVLNFWLDLGVDGFRMDAVAHLFQDEKYLDEPSIRNEDGYEDLDHVYTYDQPEVIDLLKRFRKLLDNKSAKDPSNPRIMLTEAYLPVKDLVKYYGSNFSDHSGDASHVPINFAFVDKFNSESVLTAEKVDNVIKEYLEALPPQAWPNFNLGNHDKSRVATRVGKDLVDAMNMVYLLLPGTPITYYGEEIGMEDTPMRNPNDDRDPYRTPMQWNDNANAGFTSGNNPWLKVNDNYKEVNVKAQDSTDNQKSHLAVYRSLCQLRTQKSILYGDINTLVNDTVFAMARVKKGNPGYVLAVNFGDAEVTVSVEDLPNLPETGSVHVRSFHGTGDAAVETEDDPEALWKTVEFDELTLKPKEGVVVTFVPNFD